MSNLASAFAGIKEAQEPSKKTLDKASKQKPVVAKARLTAPAKPVIGKSSHEDYGSLKVYVRKETRRKAERKWQDEGGGDVSELIEHLLANYAKS